MKWTPHLDGFEATGLRDERIKLTAERDALKTLLKVYLSGGG